MPDGNNAEFREQRAVAAVPFVVLCVALVAVYLFTKVEMVNRPALRAMGEMAATAPQQPQAEPPPSPMEGKPVPDFTLPTLDGKTFNAASVRGKILFINIWATWCAPCREEMPSMERLYKQMKGLDFEMVGISIDKDGKKAVAPFVKELGITFPILMDPQSATSAKFNITGVPETFLVNRDGTILHHLVGPTEWDTPAIVGTLKDLVAKTAGLAATKKGAQAARPAGTAK
jgi:peroxiredoxin